MSVRKLLVLCRLAAVTGLLSVGTGAQAQLPLPPLPGSTPLSTQQLPVYGLTRQLDATLRHTATELDSHADNTLRAVQIRDLLRNQRSTIEADPNGAPIVRSQVLALSPSDTAIAGLQGAGFTIAGEQVHAELGIKLVVIAPPAGMTTAAALRKLRQLDPAGSYDFNQIYLPSGATDSSAVAKPAVADTALTGTVNNNDATHAAVGLIDSGVDIDHPVFQHANIQHWGCDGKMAPSAHGTATASLLIGNGNLFRGVVPGAPLYIADVYCGAPTGGALDAITAACAWLAQAHVAVINISLVGPPNILLEHVIGNMIARGHVIVAAVGNDGPSAPPLYPAAYPDVVGVTAVDARNRVLVEAGRGPQVDFAAPGADMAAAIPHGGFAAVRGTSFAAPIVAGLLSSYMAGPDRAAAIRALEQLSVQAVDLGAHGYDHSYGRGLVGATFRIAPSASLIGTPKISGDSAGPK